MEAVQRSWAHTAGLELTGLLSWGRVQRQVGHRMGQAASHI